MRTWVVLYVLSTVAITITKQAAVRPMLHSLHEDKFWRLLYDDVAKEALGIGHEHTHNSRNWKNRGRPLKQIWDDVFGEGRDTDWIFRHGHMSNGLKGRNNKGSRDMHFVTSDETPQVKSDGHVDSTLLKPVYEEYHDLSLETENWTPKTEKNENEDNKSSSRRMPETWDSISAEVLLKIVHEDTLWPHNNDEKLSQTDNWTTETNNKNVGADDKQESDQWSESRDSIPGEIPPKIDHEDRLWPQINDEKPHQTSNWTSKTNNTNRDEDNILKTKQRAVTQDNISGKVPPKIDHEDRVWPQNKDEKPSTVNPLGNRKVHQWPDRHSYVQKGNDYWYISDEHPGVAFVLSGISLAGPRIGLFGGEWLQNTAIGEMGDLLPWEQNVKSRNGPNERPEDISLTTRKSKLGIEGERTVVFTPDHSHHSIS